MSDRYQGGVIRAVPLEPTSSSASGIWTMEQQAKAQAAGDWPAPPPPPVQVDRSLRFDSAGSANLSRTPGSAGNRKTWTWSGWVKRSGFSVSGNSLFNAYSGSDYGGIFFDGNNYLSFQDRVSASNNALLVTTQVFRDPSAWYHIVVTVDTTQSTSSNRIKFYVNGSQVTAFGTATYPTQDLDVLINNNILHEVGALTSGLFFDGYMANIDFVDGLALDPSYFGQTNATTGVWEPITTVGYLTYGTNGFHLDFSNNTSTTTIGYDTSGNGNNWTANNFSVSAGRGNDSLVDTPTPYGTDTGAGGEVGGNYCTLNPVGRSYGSNIPLNGSLDVTGDLDYTRLMGTVKPQSGKWYWEYTVRHNSDSDGGNFVGITNTNSSIGTSGNRTYQVASAYSFFTGYTGLSQGLWTNGSETTNLGTTATSGEIIQFAIDIDSNKLWIGKNGTWYSSGDPAAGTNQLATITSGTAWVPFDEGYRTGTWNFGQRPFAYTAPSGFKALCTTNLPEPDVVQGDTAFNTVLYTGTGASLGVTGVGFQPDFTWIKSRSAAVGHIQVDAVRGATKYLQSNNTNGEGTDSNVVASFGADGFTVGSDATTGGSGSTYVAWNWKANGAGSSNTDGSITSTVSVNTTAGISVVTYTGTGSLATVGHGLGAAPSVVICKNRSTTTYWAVYHASMGNTYGIELNDTAAATVQTAYWNSTSPTSSVFTVNTDNRVNGSSNNMVAYCFAPVEGFSAFGSYTGNGSTDGPFVYTGFRPAFVLTKPYSGIADHWNIFDNTRSTYNVINKNLKPNLSNAEATDSSILVDFVSNGFKLRQTDGQINGSPYGYIYMAFAENPFKYSLAR